MENRKFWDKQYKRNIDRLYCSKLFGLRIKPTVVGANDYSPLQTEPANIPVPEIIPKPPIVNKTIVIRDTVIVHDTILQRQHNDQVTHFVSGDVVCGDEHVARAVRGHAPANRNRALRHPLRA